LKYTFLSPNQHHPVIIASDLTPDQEERLVHILTQHSTALGWTIFDIQGVSPNVCSHRIHLEENAKTSREPQRRLNPAMKEVVRAEILKLLDSGIIYPISDSQWVSPIHVVPKKSGVTVVKIVTMSLSLPAYKPAGVFVLIIESSMLSLAKTTSLSHTLTRCLNVWRAMPTTVFLMDIQGTTKYLLPLKTKKKLPLPVLLAHLRTLVCHLAFAMHPRLFNGV